MTATNFLETVRPKKCSECSNHISHNGSCYGEILAKDDPSRCTYKYGFMVWDKS